MNDKMTEAGEMLASVREFARKAHGSQRRKYSNEQYVLHLERVMKRCSQYTSDTGILAAALLHDVLEDTPITWEEIAAFLETMMDYEEVRRVVKLVEELTDVYIKENFPAYNRSERKRLEVDRLAAISRDAQTIKYADVIDNTMNIVDHDRAFAAKLLSEGRDLLQRANQGNAQLYALAVKTVEDGLRRLEENG